MRHAGRHRRWPTTSAKVDRGTGSIGRLFIALRSRGEENAEWGNPWTSNASMKKKKRGKKEELTLERGVSKNQLRGIRGQKRKGERG